MAECPYCGNKENNKVINVENSDSTWDDWDQDITYECSNCNKEFHFVW